MRFLTSSKLYIPNTVKLGVKERFDKEQIGVKEPLPVKIVNLLQKDKEHLALRNNFRVSKKFLTTKFDCNMKNWQKIFSLFVFEQIGLSG